MLAAIQSSGVALGRILPLAVTLVVILGIVINQLNLSDDPYRCNALLHEGSWLNAPDNNGSRAPFTNWQPKGCMLHKYKKEEIADCMEGRHMLFFGDSTTRQIFYGMARLVSSRYEVIELFRSAWRPHHVIMGNQQRDVAIAN